MSTATGINHIAYCTADMKEQLSFYTEVIGMKLKALFWMHGIPGAYHAFMEMSPANCMTFVFHPSIKDKEAVMGVSHVPHTVAMVPAGVTQHIAFNMESLEDLQTLIERVRRHGYNISDLIDHDFCQSAYMLAPENVWIEFTVTVRDFQDVDIDDEVVSLCGISPEELARMREPDLNAQPDEARLAHAKAQSDESQKRMEQLINALQQQGQDGYQKEYKHGK